MLAGVTAVYMIDASHAIESLGSMLFPEILTIPRDDKWHVHGASSARSRMRCRHLSTMFGTGLAGRAVCMLSKAHGKYLAFARPSQEIRFMPVTLRMRCDVSSIGHDGP